MSPALRRLLDDPRARVGALTLSAMLLLSLFAPPLLQDPSAFVANPLEPPSLRHLFGTTGQGQDVLAQTVAGARQTLLIGFTVGASVMALGALIGMTAGFVGGWLDDLLSTLINVFLLIPGLPLAVILAGYLPPGPVTLTLVLVVTGWAWNARVLRAQTRSLRDRDFMLAARTLGETPLRLVFVELLPNMGSVLASGFIGATVYAIGAQVGLEFLGLGDLGTVSWGTNLYWAAQNHALLTESWWTIVPSGLGIALVGFSLTQLSFAIDEIANPRLARRPGYEQLLRKAGVALGSAVAVTPVLRAPSEKPEPTP